MIDRQLLCTLVGSALLTMGSGDLISSPGHTSKNSVAGLAAERCQASERQLDYRAAARCYQRLAKTVRGQERHWAALQQVRVLIRLGDIRAADTAIEELRPRGLRQTGIRYYFRGVLAHLQGRFEEAVDQLKTALAFSLEPFYETKALSLLASDCRRLGNHRESEVMLALLRERHPRSPEAAAQEAGQ